MHIMNSLFSAFLMYSRLPMPRVEWREENRRYALCFFPIVGAVIGGLLLLWNMAGSVNDLLFAAIAAAIPVLVTGGIHLDGFCDVCDAKACWGTKEKMLEVMDDPRVGSFAVINLCLYFLMQAGLFAHIRGSVLVYICALAFVQSRAWSALAAVTFKNAKAEGSLQSFTRPAHKNITIAAEIFYLIVTAGAMVFVEPVSGICAALGGAAAFIYYRHFSYKKFGGITGDLAGYFLQICELSIMAFAVAGSLITEAVL